MEDPAFDSQLSEEQLAELGRLTVNFGYAELLLDWLIGPALEIRNQDATRELVSPLTLDRKIKLLRSRLDLCAVEEAKGRLANALDVLSAIKDDRNTITHGYWALENGVGAAVFNRKKAAKPANVRSATELADEAAKATRLLYEALDLLNGRDPTKSAPDILVPREDGSFGVVRKGAGRA